MNKITVCLSLMAWVVLRGAASAAEPAKDNASYGLPVVTRCVEPVRFFTNGNGSVFCDFGKDAFGWLEILPPAGFTGGVYRVALGEKCDPGDMVDCWPGGTIRAFVSRPTAIKGGEKVHRVITPRDPRNTNYSAAAPAVKMRPEIGVIMPFRYAEFFESPFPLTPQNVRQVAVNYPIDMAESSFACSDKRLETVYEFCKYSILATSFAGIYVDGDRERIPYEADAYINMLSHYAISSDTALARFSHEYLMDHPTWPTEWKQHSVMMAWTDWMQTGDLTSVARCYARLKKDKMLLDRAREDGLLTSRNYLEGRRTRNDDIIDWPPRDRDGYVFTHVSSVINAFHYLNLRQMADLAAALGKTDDATFFSARAARVYAAFQRVFFNPATGRYRDGEGTDHETLHGNAAALAFGLVPEDRRRAIGDYLADRGMVCSVYFSQYYLEALYVGGRADAAYARLTAEDDRSWLGMLKQGTTITLESWNMSDKPNLDWNHAWGTPALNILSRYVLGVTPAAPGWSKARIAPQLGPLARVSGVVPTPRGSIRVTHARQADGTVKSDVVLPPGMVRE